MQAQWKILFPMLCVSLGLARSTLGDDPVLKGRVLGHDGMTPVRAEIDVWVEDSADPELLPGRAGDDGRYEIVLKGYDIPERVKIRVSAIGCQPASRVRTIDHLVTILDDILLDADPLWYAAMKQSVEQVKADVGDLVAEPVTEWSTAEFTRVAASFERVADLRWKVNETRFMERQPSPFDVAYARKGYEDLDADLNRLQDQLMARLITVGPVPYVFDLGAVAEVKLRYGDQLRTAEVACSLAKEAVDNNLYGEKWWLLSDRLTTLTADGRIGDAKAEALSWSSLLNKTLVGEKATVLREVALVSIAPEFTGHEEVDRQRALSYLKTMQVFVQCARKADKQDRTLQEVINIKIKPLVTPSGP